MRNTFGQLFSVTTFGESHGVAVGAVVDGCPARMALTEADIQPQMTRRRPGQSALTTPRQEADTVEILSGTENGVTLGTPIALSIRNLDMRKCDYRETSNVPRPSHADFTYKSKYGILANSGGGRASARETAARVAAGAIAEKFLRERHGIDIVAWVSQVADIDAPDMTEAGVTRAMVDSNLVRCPDSASADRMKQAIEAALADGDSLGGVVTCVCRNVPVGLGEPVFDKMTAVLAHAMLSLPAVKGFDVGMGFSATRLRGSQYNDMFVMKNGRLGTVTNRGGGLQGGLTNGEPVVFRVAFRPTATIQKPQATVDYDGKPVTFALEKGRHDPCVLPRAVVVVEAMASLVLADMALISGAYGRAR